MPPFSPDDRPGHHHGWHYDDINRNNRNEKDLNDIHTTNTENSASEESLIEILLDQPQGDSSTNTDPYSAFDHDTNETFEELHDRRDTASKNYCFDFETDDCWLDDDQDECGFGSGGNSGTNSNGDDYHHFKAQNPHRFRPSLKTIFERKVAFAGTLVAGGAFVSDALTVFPIDSEYTPEEKRKLWYTRGELARFRRASVDTALAVSRNPRGKVLYQQCPLSFRGLEHLIDHAISDDEEAASRNTTKSRRWNAVRAVLDEQDRMRFYCYQLYQYYSNCSSMVCDFVEMGIDERLRSVYIDLGETEQSLATARKLAALDESHARELWREDIHHNRDSGPRNSYYCHHYKDDDTGRLLSEEERLIETHSPQSDGVRGVLQKLLVPVLHSFLEIREGDIFMDIGELCCD